MTEAIIKLKCSDCDAEFEFLEKHIDKTCLNCGSFRVSKIKNYRASCDSCCKGCDFNKICKK